MSPVHTIQLRGPWVAQTAAESGQHSVPLNIKSAGDWNAWLNVDRFSGQLTLVRQFNWTFPRPAPSVIQLVVVGRIPERIVLNGQAIRGHADDHACQVDITGRIQTSNRLGLEYQLDEFGRDDGLIDSVALRSID